VSSTGLRHNKLALARQETYAKFSGLYHTLHVCGHAVPWTNAYSGLSLKDYPCPRRGAESGCTLPLGVNIPSNGPSIIGFLVFSGEALRNCPFPVYHIRNKACCLLGSPSLKCEG
jgi:hypothetical protein